MLDQVLALGAPPLVREYVYTGGAAEPSINPPQNPGAIGYCLSVRRSPLDYLLLQRAAHASTVDIAERTRLTDLLWEDGRVVGVRLMTPAGERSSRARIVVGADGRHSFVARAIAAAAEEEEPPRRALYYCYARDFPGPNGSSPDGPEFSFLDDEVAYVFPSDNGVTCVALSMNLGAFGWMKQALEARFRERIAAHPGIASRFEHAVRERTILGQGPEYSYVRVPVGPGWALVGDAGLHQDPWSGRGMDMAGIHASFLGEALLAWFGGSMSEAEALSGYHQRRNEHGLADYRRTVTLARDLRQLAKN